MLRSIGPRLRNISRRRRRPELALLLPLPGASVPAASECLAHRALFPDVSEHGRHCAMPARTGIGIAMAKGGAVSQQTRAPGDDDAGSILLQFQPREPRDMRFVAGRPTHHQGCKQDHSPRSPFGHTPPAQSCGLVQTALPVSLSRRSMGFMSQFAGEKKIRVPESFFSMGGENGEVSRQTLQPEAPRPAHAHARPWACRTWRLPRQR